MKKRKSSKKKQIQFAAAVIITVVLFFIQYYSEQNEKTQTPAPVFAEQSAQSSANRPTQSPEAEKDKFDNVKVVSVYDGDTFKINLNCSEAVLCNEISVRVRGIDCPEIKGKTEKEKKAAKKAKQFTENFLASGNVSLENCGRDKYFRLLCDVKSGGKDLAKELLKKNLAYKYDGGTKEDYFK